MSSLLDPEMTFASLAAEVGLDVRLRKAVAGMGLVRPTLVQSKCLPLALSSGRDLMVRAKTGSGKTLAYCLPLLQKILAKKLEQQQQSSSSSRHNNDISAVILVPTRELCSQVTKVLQALMYYCNEHIKLAPLSGSHGRGKKAKEEMTRQEALLRDRPDVVVATPTGLAHHIQNGTVELKSSVETVVVDEADLVLSFGHEKALREIIGGLPKIYQGFLMSATLSEDVDSIKKIFLNSPVILKLEEDDDVGVNRKLKQFYLCLPKKDKGLVIYVFLKLGLLRGKGLFFVNTTDAAYRLKLLLEQFHIRSSVLNGELPIHSRLNIIEQYNVGNFDYLIATDESAANTVDSNEVDDNDNHADEGEKKKKAPKRSKKRDSEYGVSRGLDFRKVAFVVNVDFPQTAKSYAHRVGRTARGGASGVALSLVEMESDEQMEMLEKVQEDQPDVPVLGSATEQLQPAAPKEGDPEDMAGIPAPQMQPQPSPLDFDLHEIEGFRYRVEDVSRAVTRMAVKETRAAELKAEILNSERLQYHFEENPTDLQLLRHDRVATHVSKVQEHLKHVPKYLLPRGMQVAKLNKKRKRKKARVYGGRRTDNDPLQAFDGAGDVDLGNVAGAEEEDGLAEFFEDDDGEDDSQMMAKKQKTGESEGKLFTGAQDGTGESTAGRNKWKERHRKGKFSGKARKSERKHKAPLGI
ncbi:RNA helicase DBP9 [Seminavis robusta]|uniref:RNA helicase n=1 Tax=Seminavis robusta TaxID=568900 RepID=A0A9N8H7W4_9STRA|nr:RNA helicase DBP9 [Seminavis robusta]|eukprot:Sro216_g089540.1 RNA helicase DBP9 (692) ;mRNA; f:79527-81912